MSKYDLKEVTEYIRQAAIARGIDPDIAVRVARSEGLARNTWQSNVRKNGIREPSYGPFQMLIGGPGTGFPTGLGNELLNRGIDPRDPANMNKVIDFALDTAARDGWRQWHGAAKAGIGRFDGIDRSRGRSQEAQYASNTSANPDSTIDFDSMVRTAPQYRTVYDGEDPTGQEGYALSGTGRTTEYASDPRQITANEDQSGQEGYSLSGAGRVENPPLDYLKERQSRLYPPFGGDPNRPLPSRGAPPPPSGPPTFQQQAQAFDPNSIDQNAWIDPYHGRMMAYNHAVQTGNTRVAEALVNPSTMQTYLNPTGIAHGFSSAILDRASGEIDATREEEEHKKSSAQSAASFFSSLFR
jgi:hypothetical protein